MFRILGALRIYHLNHFQQPNELELHYGSLLCQELHRILEAVVLPKMICYVILLLRNTAELRNNNLKF